MKNGETTLRHLLAPIDDLRTDPSVTEIVINRPGEVGTERGGVWTWREVPDFTFDRLDAIALLTGRMTNREADPAHPLCGSTFPDGERVQICRPPATAADIIAMCIRKPPKTPRRLDDPDLIALFSEVNTGPAKRSETDGVLLDLYHAKDWLRFLAGAVKARKTIGSTGLTGSGKSDFLRRLLGAVPETDRVVTIESDPEFGAAAPRNSVALFYNDDRKGQTAVDVVKASLRMFPKTIAFQEVRGPESFALIRAIISGHNSFTSWHADEGDEIGAMAMMLRQSEPCQQAPQEQLTAMVERCFDIIVSFRKEGGEFRVRRVWFKAAEQESEGK
nr:ATPase, T2SS/T4P/T4SS family [uncultured Rhodopila sp.]